MTLINVGNQLILPCVSTDGLKAPLWVIEKKSSEVLTCRWEKNESNVFSHGSTSWWWCATYVLVYLPGPVRLMRTTIISHRFNDALPLLYDDSVPRSCAVLCEVHSVKIWDCQNDLSPRFTGTSLIGTFYCYILGQTKTFTSALLCRCIIRH